MSADVTVCPICGSARAAAATAESTPTGWETPTLPPTAATGGGAPPDSWGAPAPGGWGGPPPSAPLEGQPPRTRGMSPGVRIAAGVVGAVVVVAGVIGIVAGASHKSSSTQLVNAHGVSITAPAGWKVVGLSVATLTAGENRLSKSNPQLASLFKQTLTEFNSGELRYFAYGPHTSTFQSSASILVAPSDGATLSGAVSSLKSELGSSATSVVANAVTLPAAGPAEMVTYTLHLTINGGTDLLEGEQVYVLSGSDIGVLTMTQSSGQNLGAQFTQMADSFKLT